MPAAGPHARAARRIRAIAVAAACLAAAPAAAERFPDGRIRYQDGALYTGEIWIEREGALNLEKRRYPDGKGTLTWPDGARFEGQFEKGEPRHGTYYWSPKEWCSGRVTERFVFDEVAQCTFATGATYTGGMQGSRPHGEGKMAWPSGDRFEGTFANGSPVRGTYHAKSGAACEGEMNADYRLDGEGRCVYASGAVYEGGFKDGVRDGDGSIRYTTGAAYDGAWVNGKMHGRGEYVWPDGTRFKGGFANDAPHGTGLHVGPDGGEPRCVRMENGTIAETLDKARCQAPS